MAKDPDNMDMEIDEGTGYTSYPEAVETVRVLAKPCGTEVRSLEDAAGYVCAEDLYARVDNPSRHSSQKDGFAVCSADLNDACADNPCVLTVVGAVFAGGDFNGTIVSGQAVRVCTGAPLPDGADAIVASEFCIDMDDSVRIMTRIRPGQNVTTPGENMASGMKVAEKGTLLMPSRLSILAVAGIDRITVYRKPRFGILSIGDELVMPGQELENGQIYASNLVYNRAWMTLLGIPYLTETVPDDADRIRTAVMKLLQDCDALITSGGVMHSERDLIVGVLDELGWEMKFRHVRMGPGKATAFGLAGEKPVFCFSGGPGSNALAFLQFALSGISMMFGLSGHPLKTVHARLTKDIRTRNVNWTEFRDAVLEKQADGGFRVTPVSGKNRLLATMQAECFIVKPEGVEELLEGQLVLVQIVPGTTGVSEHFSLS